MSKSSMDDTASTIDIECSTMSSNDEATTITTSTDNYSDVDYEVSNSGGIAGGSGGSGIDSICELFESGVGAGIGAATNDGKIAISDSNIYINNNQFDFVSDDNFYQLASRMNALEDIINDILHVDGDGEQKKHQDQEQQQQQQQHQYGEQEQNEQYYTNNESYHDQTPPPPTTTTNTNIHNTEAYDDDDDDPSSFHHTKPESIPMQQQQKPLPSSVAATYHNYHNTSSQQQQQRQQQNFGIEDLQKELNLADSQGGEHIEELLWYQQENDTLLIQLDEIRKEYDAKCQAQQQSLKERDSSIIVLTEKIKDFERQMKEKREERDTTIVMLIERNNQLEDEKRKQLWKIRKEKNVDIINQETNINRFINTKRFVLFMITFFLIGKIVVSPLLQVRHQYNSSVVDHNDTRDVEKVNQKVIHEVKQLVDHHKRNHNIDEMSQQKMEMPMVQNQDNLTTGTNNINITGDSSSNTNSSSKSSSTNSSSSSKSSSRSSSSSIVQEHTMNKYSLQYQPSTSNKRLRGFMYSEESAWLNLHR